MMHSASDKTARNEHNSCLRRAMHLFFSFFSLPLSLASCRNQWARAPSTIMMRIWITFTYTVAPEHNGADQELLGRTPFCWLRYIKRVLWEKEDALHSIGKVLTRAQLFSLLCSRGCCFLLQAFNIWLNVQHANAALDWLSLAHFGCVISSGRVKNVNRTKKSLPFAWLALKGS